MILFVFLLCLFALRNFFSLLVFALLISLILSKLSLVVISSTSLKIQHFVQVCVHNRTNMSWFVRSHHLLPSCHATHRGGSDCAHSTCFDCWCQNLTFSNPIVSDPLLLASSSIRALKTLRTPPGCSSKATPTTSSTSIISSSNSTSTATTISSLGVDRYQQLVAVHTLTENSKR